MKKSKKNPRSFTFEQYVHQSVREYPTLYKDRMPIDTDLYDTVTDMIKDDVLVLDLVSCKDKWDAYCKREEKKLADIPLDSYSDDHKMRMSQRVADHLFCVIGNGVYWVNGLPLNRDRSDTVPASEPEFQCYPYEGKFSWYPMCGYSAICEMAGLPEDTGTMFEDNPHPQPTFLRAAFNVLRSMLKYGIELSRHHDESDKIYNSRVDRQLDLARRCFTGLVKRHPDSVPENCQELI